MALTYNVAVKTDRMNAVLDYFDNGTLEILAADDTVLAIFSLASPAGTVTGDTWTLGFDASTVSGETGAGAGKDATKAQIKNSAAAAHITGLTAGIDANDWAASTAYTAGQHVNNGGNLYVCASGGTSAGSGGPSGTGTGISDGSAAWDYVSLTPAIGLDNVNIADGQSVSLSSASIQHA